jgi:hypothetical protein
VIGLGIPPQTIVHAAVSRYAERTARRGRQTYVNAVELGYELWERTASSHAWRSEVFGGQGTASTCIRTCTVFGGVEPLPHARILKGLDPIRALPCRWALESFQATRPAAAQFQEKTPHQASRSATGTMTHSRLRAQR